MREIILCCGQKGCPKISIEGDKCKIKFDDGTEGEMLVEEAKLIQGAIEELSES
jgi:hypothetical protein